MGIACGLVGSAMWWIVSFRNPEFFLIAALSTAIGGYFTGRLTWYWLLTRSGKTTVLRGAIAGAVTGFVFHIPSAIFSVVLILLFQFNLPLDKKLNLALVYLIGGFTSSIYLAPMIYIGIMAFIGGGIVLYYHKRGGACRPLL